MKILALDTSSNACSAALLQGNQRDFSCIERFEVAPRKHTQLILPMIDSVLDEAGLDIKQIDVLAFGRGPGAFTGVRVATGVIQAIAYGADLKIAQISSLAAIAQGFYRTRGPSGTEKVFVANDARMDEIYFAAYVLENGFMSLLGVEQVLKPEQLQFFLQQQLIEVGESWQVAGNGWSVYAEQLNTVSEQCHFSDEHSNDNSGFYPHARDIAWLAFKEAAANTLVSAEEAGPVYLRDNVAKKSLQK